MKFIAVITHRADADCDGNGWSLPSLYGIKSGSISNAFFSAAIPRSSLAKEFASDTTILEIWEWYDKQLGGGLLEIIKLQDRQGKGTF